jgi:cell division protein FtsA
LPLGIPAGWFYNEAACELTGRKGLSRKNQYIVGLDVGTTKTSALICEWVDDRLEVRGLGNADSKGLRRGVVVNLDATVNSIKQAVEEAERQAGVPVESVFVGLSGEHIKSFNREGAVAITSSTREIGKDDIRRVIETAKAVSLPSDREIVHVLPQEFVVDGQEGIGDPLGLLGTRLEVKVHIVSSAVTAAQNIVTAVNRSGILVSDTILQPLAAAESTLAPDEKEMGVALLDIGGGTTDLAVYAQGAIQHSAVLPLGGDHISNDIAVGLRTTIPQAEKIKRTYGCAKATLIQEDIPFEVPSVSGRPSKSTSKKILCELVQPRVEEMLSLIKEEIRQAGYAKMLGAGIVLTGGTASLEGLIDLAEEIFDLPIRPGQPGGLQGMGEVLLSPVYSTVVGLVLYGYRTHLQRTRRLANSRSPIVRALNWIRTRVG